ncbi:hypothetical protein HCN44_003330 [Aphidius gifuensis]|uniref:Uncharacterized protein n=1 Tax=Aphidius gifuensis TaxID=684658 RepID=A0A834XY41_APHGI|nr:hypothetical protein HCN44_003330 [Aphidius gifuensis]
MEAFGEETRAQQDTSEFLITIFNNYSENKNCKKIIEDLFYDYDEKLRLYNIIIDDVTRLAKLARNASILYEYCINHPNKWLFNDIANSDTAPRVNDIFNRLKANVRVIKDIDENIFRLLADYENDRPKNVKIPMLHNTDGCNRPFEEMMTQFETNL